MTLGDLTEPRLMVPRLLSDRHAGAIQELTRRMETTGRIGNQSGFVEAVTRRENEVPTLLTSELAVPHARGQAVTQLSFAVGRSPAGVRWGREANRVSLLFLFAVPTAETQTYLAALAALAQWASDASNLEDFKTLRDAEAMYEALRRIEIQEPSQTLTS